MFFNIVLLPEQQSKLVYTLDAGNICGLYGVDDYDHICSDGGHSTIAVTDQPPHILDNSYHTTYDDMSNSLLQLSVMLQFTI